MEDELHKRPFYRFQAHARAYLHRAIKLLARFDTEEDVASLFYAALELRFGIESRLYAYIDASAKSRGLDPVTTEYVATKLLRRLLEIEPLADRAVRMTSYRENVENPVRHSLWYTPVTKELAGMHGRLGELLHAKFFRTNRHWLLRSRLAEGQGKSLVDFRDFLQSVVDELTKACSGQLLSHPTFDSLVDEAIAEESPPQG